MTDAPPSPALQTVIDHFADVRRRMSAPSDLSPVAQFRAVCDTIMLGDEAYDASVTPAEGAPAPCEWVCAPGADPQRRLLMLHAGSFIAYARKSYRRFGAWISKATGAAVLVVDYRLAPEHPYPAGPQDVHAAFLWMRQHGPDGPGAARQSFVIGDSAGGTLALASALMLRDRGEPLPDAIVAISPILDLTGSAASYETRAKADPLSSHAAVMGSAKIYLAGADPRDPYASPLFGDLAGLPPTLILVGDAEVILDDSTRFAAKAKAAASPVSIEVWPHMVHCWPIFAAVLPEGRDAIARIGDYIHATTARRDALLDAEARRCAALLAGDIQALRPLFTTDAVHIHGDGRSQELEPYLAGLETGIRYLKMDRGAMRLHVYDHTALMMGRLDVSLSKDGAARQDLSAQVSQVWVERPDGWKMALFHATLI